MFRSSATTPGCKSEPLIFSLAPNRAEGYYRYGLVGILVVLFSYAVTSYHGLDAVALPLLGLVAAVLACIQILACPLNGPWQDLVLRFNGADWQVGKRDRWQTLTLISHRPLGTWLLMLRVRTQDGLERQIWLFAEGANDSQHRRCRQLLG